MNTQSIENDDHEEFVLVDLSHFGEAIENFSELLRSLAYGRSRFVVDLE